MRPHTTRKRRAPGPVLSTALLALSLAACAVNPVTGRTQLMLLSEAQEIRMGQEYDPQIVAEMGLYPDDGWQRYVQELGAGMAARSERPSLPWTFRVIDDPVVNAFAVPGGFIYVTRGILAYFESEAELASVLGHEIGHVTARHSAARISTQQLAQLGLAVGTVLRPDLEGLAGVAGAGLQLLFLSHSRDDERQADDLGLRYMHAAGYDPARMAGVYEMLGAVSQATGAGRTPEWLATHPHPENRRERIERQVAALDPAATGTRVGRDDYLRRLHGMTFGENPREGFFRDNLFLHPDLRFQIRFPDGWRTANQKRQVLAVSPQNDAAVILSLATQPSPDAAAREFFAQSGIQGRPTTGRIHGLAAAGGDFTAATEQGTVAGSVAFIAHGGHVFGLLAYAPQARWATHQAAARGAVGSFQELTDARALAAQPLRLEIVTLDRAMTVPELMAAHPTPLEADRVALLNRVSADHRFPVGTTVKRVVGELPR
jgi:predicted Zn-dependent protease